MEFVGHITTSLLAIIRSRPSVHPSTASCHCIYRMAMNDLPHSSPPWAPRPEH